MTIRSWQHQNHDTLASTSTYASELLAGTPLPFSIHCKKQTAGKGRRGRSWVSPNGGLYITFAVSESMLPCQIESTSLFVGLLLKKWLRQKFNLEFTLKWPNDLLFGGKKIAGILCETHVKGSQIEAVLIGIGINVNEIPDIDLPVTSLRQLLARSFDIDDLCQNLRLYFDASLNDPFHIADFSSQSRCIHQPWYDRDTNKWVNAMGLNEKGELIVRSDNSPKVITSVNHNLEWIGLRKGTIGLADVGNTSTKFGYITSHDDAKVQTFAGQKNDPAASVKALKQHTDVVAISSVNSKGLLQLQAALQNEGMHGFVVAKASKHLLQTQYDIQQLGLDRLALVEGWLACRSAEIGVLISAGTALTVDIVKRVENNFGHYYGGYITAGIGLELASLADNADLLPKLEPTAHDVETFGCDTVTAMQIGTLRKAVAFINDVLHAVRKDNTDIDVNITGGDADLLAPHIDQATIDTTLILRGICSLAFG